MTQTTAADADLYVLAGGGHRRFGRDKALAEVDGQPMLEQIIGALGPGFASTTLVCDRADRYAELGRRVITDARPGAGPMGGLAAALADVRERRGAGWLFLAPCDVVRPRPAWVDALAGQLRPSLEAVAFRSDRWDTAFAFYHTSIEPRVSRMLAADQLKMQRLLDEADSLAVALPEGLDCIPQANTEAELKRWLEP